MTAADPDAPLQAVAKLLIRSLIVLGESGESQRHAACTLAASAWSALRDTHPREAEHTGQFSWNYLQQGPQVWQVEIGRTAARRSA